MERRNSRFVTISSLRCKLFPTHMLKWPRRNRVQITCNTPSAYHVQPAACHLVRRDSSAIKFDRVEISFILALFCWLKPLNRCFWFRTVHHWMISGSPWKIHVVDVASIEVVPPGHQIIPVAVPATFCVKCGTCPRHLLSVSVTGSCPAVDVVDVGVFTSVWGCSFLKGLICVIDVVSVVLRNDEYFCGADDAVLWWRIFVVLFILSVVGCSLTVCLMYIAAYTCVWELDQEHGEGCDLQWSVTRSIRIKTWEAHTNRATQSWSSALTTVSVA